MSEKKKLIKATGIIGGGTLFSRIFGYIRDMVVANVFGAGMATDAFFVAFRIPNLLRRLIGEGALSAAFIPLFTEYYTIKSEKEAWRLATAVFSTLFLLLIAITAIGVVAMPWIISIMAPGFVKDPEKFDLTVRLSQVTFPYIFFISQTAIFMGILNALRHFAVPAFAPVLLNFSLIGSAIFLSPQITPPVMGLAFGALFAGLLQLVVHVPVLKKKGMPFRFDFSFSHPGIKKVALLMGPAVIGLGVTQINMFVNTLLASLLQEGTISYLYYSDRIVQLPLGVFGTALGTAILPTLSAFAAKGDHEKMRETLSYGLRFTLFITIPAMVGQIILALPIVELLFERGQFDHEDSIYTANALIAYSAGLWAFAAVKILGPAYFSMQDTKTPVKISIIAMVANILFCLLLMGPFGVVGIALATSLSSIVNALLLLYYLEGRVGRLYWREVGVSIFKTIGASLVMAIGCLLLFSWAGEASFFLGRALGILLTIGVGIVLFLFSAYLLKCDELHQVVDMAKRKLPFLNR